MTAVKVSRHDIRAAQRGAAQAAPAGWVTPPHTAPARS